MSKCVMSVCSAVGDCVLIISKCVVSLCSACVWIDSKFVVSLCSASARSVFFVVAIVCHFSFLCSVVFLFCPGGRGGEEQAAAAQSSRRAGGLPSGLPGRRVGAQVVGQRVA